VDFVEGVDTGHQKHGGICELFGAALRNSRHSRARQGGTRPNVSRHLDRPVDGKSDASLVKWRNSYRARFVGKFEIPGELFELDRD
jgi:hypothetical protein